MRLLEGRKAGTGQEGRMMEDGALMHVWRVNMRRPPKE